jgi:hypothetical protein
MLRRWQRPVAADHALDDPDDVVGRVRRWAARRQLPLERKFIFTVHPTVRAFERNLRE